MTTHTQMDAHTGLLPCCGLHYLERLFTGDAQTEDPTQVDCKPRIYGMCTGCGSVEVELNNVTGTRDFSDIGEPADYPTGYGCEVCS